MDNSYLLPACVFIVCLAVRDGYELLKESGRIGSKNTGAFIVVLIAMCSLWISWFILCRIDPHRIELPSVVRWAGLAVTITGGVLAVGALVQLRGLEGIDHLVTRGLFRRLRHPMYLGFILWIIGWSMFHASGAGAIIGLPGIASILWWRYLEDGRLAVQFGEAYTEYKKATLF